MDGNTALIPRSKMDRVIAMDQTCKTAQMELAEAEKNGHVLARAMIAGAAMNRLRELMDKDVMHDIMQLVGTPLGIRTDRDDKPPQARYSEEVVRDAVISGALQGAMITGNEINIMSGQCYLTKEYWHRMFTEVEGVTDVDPPTIGMPTEHAVGPKKYARVQARLRWRYNGKLQDLERLGDSAIQVIWHDSDRLETIQGRVKARLYAMAYAKVTGKKVDEMDDDLVDGEFVPMSEGSRNDPLQELDGTGSEPKAVTREGLKRICETACNLIDTCSTSEDVLRAWDGWQKTVGSFDAEYGEENVVKASAIVRSAKDRRLKELNAPTPDEQLDMLTSDAISAIQAGEDAAEALKNFRAMVVRLDLPEDQISKAYEKIKRMRK